MNANTEETVERHVDHYSIEFFFCIQLSVENTLRRMYLVLLYILYYNMYSLFYEEHIFSATLFSSPKKSHFGDFFFPFLWSISELFEWNTSEYCPYIVFNNSNTYNKSSSRAVSCRTKSSSSDPVIWTSSTCPMCCGRRQDSSSLLWSTALSVSMDGRFESYSPSLRSAMSCYPGSLVAEVWGCPEAHRFRRYRLKLWVCFRSSKNWSSSLYERWANYGDHFRRSTMMPAKVTLSYTQMLEAPKLALVDTIFEFDSSVLACSHF